MLKSRQCYSEFYVNRKAQGKLADPASGNQPRTWIDCFRRLQVAIPEGFSLITSLFCLNNLLSYSTTDGQDLVSSFYFRFHPESLLANSILFTR